MSENRIRKTDSVQVHGPASAGIWVTTAGLLKFNPAGTAKEVVELTTVQTLTNKTLTAPALTAVAITGTSTIGAGMTITSPIITGATLTSPNITGALVVTGPADPSGAQNVISVIQAAANTYSGSVVGVRSTVTVSATAAIGNAYSGRFELIQSALPASQGHTAALVAQVSATGAGNSPTSVLTLTLNSATGAGVVTPFIYFQEATANKTTLFFKADTLGTAGSGSNAVCFSTGASIAATDITAGLRVSINGAIYHIPLVATGAWDGS
jgi:hypothetical protein